MIEVLVPIYNMQHTTYNIVIGNNWLYIIHTILLSVTRFFDKDPGGNEVHILFHSK